MNSTLKILLGLAALFLLLAAVYWIYLWYQGKFAPSQQDKGSVSEGHAVAYLAGGCFWCTEHDFEMVKGVYKVTSGYMGGNVDHPSYVQVSGGTTGHREMIKVEYNPNMVSYRRLVLELLRETDPTDAGGSFYDRGLQYTSAVFYQTDEEKQMAEQAIADVTERGVFDKPIVTSVIPAGTFWVAEDYHQEYAKKNPLQYAYYRNASGRDAFIEKYWGNGTYDDLFTKDVGIADEKWASYVKPSSEELQKLLTPMEFKVTQQEGTEPPFDNAYWNNHDDGIYVDIVSGEPLFSSTDKYDSGTGWPSFLKPINPDVVTEHADYKLILPRTEIRSRYADSHLGHIILDGPKSNDYVRYCMNSASLKFIPKAEMESLGYGQYLSLFDKKSVAK